MRLTLEVISANGDVLGSNRSKTIGPEGAQIGRSKESDWVINDPYISRIHARIRCTNGSYYVEGTGRNPLALNDPSNVVPNNQPQLLRSGDRFFLDQYEIRVNVEAVAERRAQVEPLLPDSDNPTVRVPPLSAAHSWQPEIKVPDARFERAEEPAAAALDPLQILNAARPPAPGTVRTAGPDHGHVAVPDKSVPLSPPPRVLTANEPTPLPINAPTQRISEDHRPPATFEPTTRKVPPGPGENVQPQGSTSRSAGNVGSDRRLNPYVAEPEDASPPHPPIVAPTVPMHAGTPGLEGHEPRAQPFAQPFERREPWVSPAERPEVVRAKLTEPPRANAPANPPANAPPPDWHDPRGNPFERQPFERPPPPPGFSKTINRAVQPGVSITPPHEPTAPLPRDSRSASLEQLLAAAGVRDSQLSPELAEELGEVLRVVVQGLMEVLQSRAEIKSQLRMNVTLMKPAENNPLKFSPNVEAALHTLLVERNRGYLPTVRAFQEALIDVRHHQIAVLQGIRSAFHAMLEQFNPVRLEQEFERHGAKRGLLNVGGKGRFRDCYVEEFERLTRDPDASFKRLFGEYFAQAYEDQMEQLKSAARNDAR